MVQHRYFYLNRGGIVDGLLPLSICIIFTTGHLNDPDTISNDPRPTNSVAILVSEILDLVSPKDFGMTQYLILFSISLSIQEKPTLYLVYGALVNVVAEKHNFSSWLRRELATLPTKNCSRKSNKKHPCQVYLLIGLFDR